MTETPLERAARAVSLKMQFRNFGQQQPNGDWTITVAQMQDFELACKEAVRAVLEEIREPSDAIVEQGAQMHDHWSGSTTIGAINARRNVRQVWGAMIDSILQRE